jgi:hypothetical protein
VLYPAFEDMNRDGWLDVVGTAQPEVNPCFRELLATAPGTFSSSTVHDSGNDVLALHLAGDLDEDGSPDALVDTDSGLMLLRNLGDGTFAPRTPFTGGGGTALIDLDHDGHADLLAGMGSGALIRRGLGSGAYAPLMGFGAAAATTGQCLATDQTGDGFPDLWIPVKGGLLLLENRGGSELLDAPPVPRRPTALALRLRPNPSHGSVSASLSFPTPGRATVEVYGIDGRRWYSHTFDGLAGTSTVEIGKGAPLPTGIYLVRVRQGASSTLGRVAVIR